MSSKIKTIGVMDSGFGGLSVLSELANSLPSVDYIYYGDLKNSPYGKKSRQDVLQLSEEIIQFFIHEGVSAVLLACNTATSAAATELRSRYNIPIFGMEPAIKPAVLENQGEKVAVFATSLTLKEEKFNRLEKSLHAGHVIEQINCDGLANLIDSDDIPSCIDFLDPILKELCDRNINNFVLGCTHYLLIRPLFYKYNDNIKIYDGNEGTIRHIISSLSIPEVERESRIELFLNGGTDDDFQIAYRFLNANPREDKKYVK